MSRSATKKIVLVIVCIVFASAAVAQAENTGADEILGERFTDKEEAVVEIYRCGELYCGKIV